MNPSIDFDSSDSSAECCVLSDGRPENFAGGALPAVEMGSVTTTTSHATVRRDLVLGQNIRKSRIFGSGDSLRGRKIPEVQNFDVKTSPQQSIVCADRNRRAPASTECILQATSRVRVET